MNIGHLVGAVAALIRGRGKEGSTWAGVGVVLVSVGQLVPGPWGALLMALGPVAGALATVIPDRGAKPGPAAAAVTSGNSGGDIAP